MWRAQRLRNLWSWLPAFRVVAETEHLPTAAASLHVSPSALSRTIRVLEEEVGRRLFRRSGRRIRLTDAGHTLLRSVREAMRLTDEGIDRVLEHHYLGNVVIAAPTPFVPIYVLPALRALRDRYPRLVPHVVSIGGVNERLLQGRLDLALLDDPAPHEELVTEPLFTIPHGVYCGRAHPLLDRGTLELSDLQAQPFVAPVPDADNRTPDEWPAHIPREIGLRVSHMQVAIDACAGGAYLAVLPGPVAERAGLLRLPVEVAGTSTLFAVRRAELPVQSKADLVLGAIKAELDELSSA